jgi:hypothetical protein
MRAPKHDIELAAAWIVDRRAFIGTLAGATAFSLLPLSVATAASLLPNSSAPLLVDWHIDDQWGPRYAEPIAWGRSAAGDAVADGWNAL